MPQRAPGRSAGAQAAPHQRMNGARAACAPRRAYESKANKLKTMSIDENTPPRAINFEQDVIQRRPVTTQAGLGTPDATSATPGVLANDDNIVFTTVNNLVNWAR